MLTFKLFLLIANLGISKENLQLAASGYVSYLQSDCISS